MLHHARRRSDDQGRINHCAGCTMGKGRSPPGGGGDQLPNFYHAVLTFERSSVGLNVTTTTTKKVVNFLRRKSAARPEKKVRAQRKSACPEKILAARMRKGPPPDVGMGPTNG